MNDIISAAIHQIARHGDTAIEAAIHDLAKKHSKGDAAIEAAINDLAKKHSEGKKVLHEEIAVALEGWYKFWGKKQRVYYKDGTEKMLDQGEDINKDWIREFAERIRKGTLVAPNGEPDALYET